MADDDYRDALDQSIEDAKSAVEDMDNPDFKQLLVLEQKGRDRETMKQWLANQWDTHIEDLDELVDHFEKETDKALDIQEEKQQLEDRVKMLREKKSDLEETVDDLKSTKKSLEQGIKQKEEKVEEMKDQLKDMKDDKAELKSEKHSLQRKVENLEEEKETLEESLSRTEDLLINLKHKVREFDEELEA